VCCAVSLLRLNKIVYVIAALAGVVGSVWVVFLDDSFTISRALGGFVPDVVLIIAICIGAWSCCCGKVAVPPEDQDIDDFGPFSQSATLCIFGALVIFIGAFVQVTLGNMCGVPCPKDCPLPAPMFNHNALFHLVQAVGMGLSAKGMDKVCRSLEVQRYNEMLVLGIGKQ